MISLRELNAERISNVSFEETMGLVWRYQRRPVRAVAEVSVPANTEGIVRLGLSLDVE